MIILKSDIVRTSSGLVGEVTEVWGLARTFLRIKPTEGKKTIIVFETDVSELIKRPKSPRGRG